MQSGFVLSYECLDVRASSSAPPITPPHPCRDEGGWKKQLRRARQGSSPTVHLLLDFYGGGGEEEGDSWEAGWGGVRSGGRESGGTASSASGRGGLWREAGLPL